MLQRIVFNPFVPRSWLKKSHQIYKEKILNIKKKNFNFDSPIKTTTGLPALSTPAYEKHFYKNFNQI